MCNFSDHDRLLIHYGLHGKLHVKIKICITINTLIFIYVSIIFMYLHKKLFILSDILYKTKIFDSIIYMQWYYAYVKEVYVIINFDNLCSHIRKLFVDNLNCCGQIEKIIIIYIYRITVIFQL